jgi:hypothetical protein
VSVSNAGCSNCTAATSNRVGSYGTNSYGGSMSVLYVGAYALSYSSQASSSSSSGSTSISGVSVSVSNAGCSNCTAATSSRSDSLGANSYGGSLSVLYVGAYAWSRSFQASSSSSSESTSISGVSVSVSNAGCSNCTAATSSRGDSLGANSYGGSLSVLYVGAYAWSYTSQASSSSSGSTSISGVSVSVSNAGCSNCTAATSSQGSIGANSYGGSLSVLYVGAYGYSYSNGAYRQFSRSYCDFTRVIGLNVSVQTSDIRLSRALSRALPCVQHRLSSRSCFRSS